MQRKKNIRLFITLVVLLVVTTAIFLYKPQSNNLDKKLFSLPDIESIDRIEIENTKSNIVLTLKGRQWKLNGKHTANIARINDLLVVLEKVSVRRKISTAEQDNLKQLFNLKGATVKVFLGEKKVKEYKVVENKKGTLSYFIDENGIGYICNLSGYNYNIAQFFSLTAKKWRSNYVFASNWTTLEKLAVSLSGEEGFEIRYDPAGYYIENVNELDTARMYDYLEKVSYLQVAQFLNEAPVITEKEQMSIRIGDAGSNSIHLIFYQEGEKYYGQIDSSEWATFRKSDVLNLMKRKEWFEIRE